MTEQELSDVLEGNDLLTIIDIKTLVLDYYMRYADIDEIVSIFQTKLPDLDPSYVKRFIYMQRD